MASTFHTVQTDCRGVDIEVEVDITPGERGSRDRYGAPLEPDSEADFDIIKVVVGIHQGETEIEITPLLEGDVIDEIKAKVWLVLNDNFDPDNYDRD